MKLLHPRQSLKDNTVVTIGTFDGVHLGHRRIFGKVQETARRNGLSSVMITFEPPPKRFFSNGEIENLTTLSEKIDILSEIGIDYLLVLPFNRELVNTGWKDFVKKTLDQSLRMKYLIMGYDFRMGKDQEGSPEKLLKLPFFVSIISPYMMDNQPIKSSLIREVIISDEIEKANKYLGYNYILSGARVEGLGIARKLGFPTINFRPSPEKLIPANGVYLARSLDGKRFGLLYIGNRPTYNLHERTMEIHFLDYDESEKKTFISIEIIKKMRSERKFASENALIQQLAVDKKQTIALINRENFE